MSKQPIPLRSRRPKQTEPTYLVEKTHVTHPTQAQRMAWRLAWDMIYDRLYTYVLAQTDTAEQAA